MKKHMRVTVPLIGLALVAIFVAGSNSNSYRKLGGNFLAAIGFQNATSSQDTTSSTSKDAPDATSTPTLGDALRQLQNQIQSLSNRMTELRSEIEIANLRSIFTRTLKRGDTGDDVSKLQELLTRFPELYSADTDVSSTMTGFYGSLTRAAVMRFQAHAGLQETGVFGASTREKFYESLNTLAEDSASAELTLIDISSIAGLNNSDNSQNQNSANARGDIAALQDQLSQLVSDSTSTQTTVADLQNQVSQLSSDLTNANQEIANLKNQLSAQQPSPPPPSPTPAPTPLSSLVISNIQAANIAKASSTIIWTTNTLSTSEVHYSTDATLPASKTIVVSNSAAVINHTMALRSLNNGTKYYYWVLSKDSNNTTASSTIQNFTTLY